MLIKRFAYLYVYNWTFATVLGYYKCATRDVGKELNIFGLLKFSCYSMQPNFSLLENLTFSLYEWITLTNRNNK